MLATLGALVVSSVVALSAHASVSKRAPRPPAGAVKLRKTSLERVSGTLCGKVRGRWIPGTMVDSVYFLSDLQQAHNYAVLARRAKGHARKRDLARSRSYARLAKKRQKVCARAAGKDGSVTSPSPGVPTPSSAPTPLRFNLAGAIGLALQGTSQGAAQDDVAHAAGDTGSNLDTVNAAGQLADAVTSGSATISHIFIGPDGNAYVVFSGRVDLDNTSSPTTSSSGCILAEVDRSSGIPTCIDSSLASITWNGFGAPASVNPPIQFDSTGAIYYSGTPQGGGTTTVLRKYFDGTSTSLLTNNVTLSAWVVLPNGTVIVSGYTDSPYTQWTRRISPTGGLSGLGSTFANFLTVFPDNNVYMGLYSAPGGVVRYLAGSDQMDSKAWINESSSNAYFGAYDLCSADSQPPSNPFCNYSGSYITWSDQINGNEFVLAGMGPTVAMQYYPTVQFLPTQVANVTIAEGAGDNLLLAGQDANGNNILTLFNTVTNGETQLIGPANQIEIYDLKYSASQNKVLFDGLRFSDNAYVLGEVDLSTDQVTVVNAGSTKWADVQAFG